MDNIDDAFNLALRNSILHSIGDEIYKECKISMPSIMQLYFDYKINEDTMWKVIKICMDTLNIKFMDLINSNKKFFIMILIIEIIDGILASLITGLMVKVI